jgi:ssDNA-binding replication factor A large subunit
MQNSSSVDMANVNVKNVSQGMMRVVDSLDGFKKAEKYAILSAVFNCLYINKMKKERSISDVMEMIGKMRRDCKFKQIPEFGGAEKYIIGEL